MLPAERHAVVSGAHFPDAQDPLQHCESVVQVASSETHAEAPHFPPLHVRLQHSVDEAQLAPAGEQLDVPRVHECVAASQIPEQQSAPDLHVSANL